MNRTLKTGVWLALAAAALAAARHVVATLSGGPFSVPLTMINSGGGTMAGGNKSLAFTMGAPSASMMGGPFSLKPGVVSSVRSAQYDLQAAHAYPIPFKPSLGHDKITFTRLTTQATINVYTVSGEKVKTLTKDDGSTDSLVWKPVANEQGSALASGVYIYVISSPGIASQKGKLMIVR